MNRSRNIEAKHWLLGGRVQGVGFRPFVYRLAQRFGLAGWVINRTGQVEIFVEGPASALAQFAHALIAEAPPLARPEVISNHSVAAQALAAFTILPSTESARPRIHVPPDYFACDDCLRELRDPRDRRYRYPFINCTQCGPRYTLIARLPYDRPNTTMAGFTLCPDCRQEYENPADRRFHAEPIACPVCGPGLRFVSPGAPAVEETGAALAACIGALKAGSIVAVKGVGGYHLMCDARDDAAIARLRQNKPRPHKPLAVMFPWRGADGLDAVRESVAPDPEEARLLRDPTRPIVLVRKRAETKLSALIAPGLKEIGAFLPYSPLHHLLLDAFGAPLVATSANVRGEPVLTDNAEVEARLVHVAETFLHHNRPIERPADDPVFRVIADRPRPIRLGRGIGPLELALPSTLRRPVLAVGGHMKNTVALAWDDRVVVSPHIGDLDAPRSLAVFEQTVADLQRLYGVRAEGIVCDAHPGYASTRWAIRSGLPLTKVFHHHAHASALSGEHSEVRRWLVFAWDGVGYGEDGTLWGGEALLGRPGAWKRVASMRPFRLPGGERAAREPWRSAVALCWEAGIEWCACPRDTALLRAAWGKRLNAPPSSAVGRLFDAAAALTGVNLESSFEGQGPTMLEAVAGEAAEPVALPLAPGAQGVACTDWAPLLPVLMDDARSVAARAAVFHESLAHALAAQARHLRARHGEFTVGLGGGVFQNRILTERALALLAAAGFDARLGVTIPCSDAGIGYGQVIEFIAAA